MYEVMRNRIAEIHYVLFSDGDSDKLFEREDNLLWRWVEKNPLMSINGNHNMVKTYRVKIKMCLYKAGMSHAHYDD